MAAHTDAASRQHTHQRERRRERAHARTPTASAEAGPEGGKRSVEKLRPAVVGTGGGGEEGEGKERDSTSVSASEDGPTALPMRSRHSTAVCKRGAGKSMVKPGRIKRVKPRLYIL